MVEKDKVIENQSKEIKAFQNKMKEYEATIKTLKGNGSNAHSSPIKVGDEVFVKPKSKIYQKQNLFNKWVYESQTPFIVREISGDRAVFYNGKSCIGPININDLQKAK